MRKTNRFLLVGGLLVAIARPWAPASAQTAPSAPSGQQAPPPVVQAAEGFSVELVAGPPLTERPIVGAFDDHGRLYVAESSGSNDPVEQQLAERPHRVVCLEDLDGDGRYDKRTVFADRMMFPEGAMWLDGSLYVSAPPSIWKLSDRDGDGVADERVEWFQGKTLTGCANDLHGPYAGPDGWVYWCKGAFAEQTHLVNGRQWKTRASHIFRCRPDGSGLEPVMTGGMDNPVDVAFTPEGERIFSATFLEGDGRQDGLAHTVYGGMFGKEHGVLDGHPRTGELMPAITCLDAAAPCGLERYDGESFGPEYRDNLFLCEFNMRRVSRHVLTPMGSTFTGESSPMAWSDHVDFHPTDVLVDADGSLLVFDTGGWYKLCCPTSQLWKPDVLGGIYRVRRIGAQPIDDPRGLKLPWDQLTPEDLWARLADERPAVRRRASRALAALRATPQLQSFLEALASRPVDAILAGPEKRSHASRDVAALARAWALVQADAPQCRSLLRKLLTAQDESVRHVALQAASLWRDGAALAELRRIVLSDTPALRRVAAEALGRIGDRSAVPDLLAAAAKADDRVLQHSVTYALIELADPLATAAGLASEPPAVRAVALAAVDQMPGGGLTAADVVPSLNAENDDLRRIARWLVERHPEWGGELAGWFAEQLTRLDVGETRGDAESLRTLLPAFAGHVAIQNLLADWAADPSRAAAARALALGAMTAARLTEPPPAWTEALAAVIQQGDAELLGPAIEAVRKLPGAAQHSAALRVALEGASRDQKLAAQVRTAALAAVAAELAAVSPEQFELILDGLSNDATVVTRSAAAEAAAKAPLDAAQRRQLCQAVATVGPLELNRLLEAFAGARDEALGVELIAALKQSPALASLRLDLLRQTLAEYGPDVQRGVAELESLVNVDIQAQRNRIEELLPKMAGGDVRRGHTVFNSSKAACSACHRMGYAGGSVGPELSRIGEIRTERDLLESILFPSLSFVRSYEPVVILTADGRAVNGAIRDESDAAYVLVTGPNEEVRVPREDVEEVQPSTVSVMPAGLDKQLSEQELADLVAFLKNAK